jgi:pyruvate dehydrogenase (quinone)
MAQLVSDFIVQRLREWGVHRIFGFPGDGINGILGALNRANGNPEFILARHEEMAAFMACGHAKFTGELGVCLATSGPGAIHLLNGLYDAKMDHQPVLAIVGQSARYAMGGDFQQEVDLISLFKDVAHHYVHMLTVPHQLPDLIDRAIRIALAERSVTCLIIPNDIQSETMPDQVPHKHGYVPGGLGFTPPRIFPEEAEIRRAANVLNAGERVAILVGQGAAHAEAEVLEIADKLGAGIAKALLGRAVLSDELPFVTGAIGLLGTRPSYELMRDCDTLLMIGSSFPYFEFLPKPGQARGVQIDISGKFIGFRYPMEVNLVGDAKDTLRLLTPHLEKKTDRGWREKIEKNVAEWWQVTESQSMADAEPLNPQRVFWELSSRLPDNCILTSDSGSAANWFARQLKLRPGMMASLSGNLATMGPGVPYAIAAKFAHPQRHVIALVGDGAMQMNGNGELVTIAQYWRRWEDPRLTILVLHNNDLNQVTWEMRAFEGDPKYEASQNIFDFPFARYAELLGLKGIRVDRPDDLGDAWDETLNADRPALLEAITDPNVPPLPPHITYDQAKSFTLAMVKRDPDALSVIRRSASGMFRNIWPR